MRKWMVSIGAALVVFLIALYGLSPATIVRMRTERILQTHFESKIEFFRFPCFLVSVRSRDDYWTRDASQGKNRHTAFDPGP